MMVVTMMRQEGTKEYELLAVDGNIFGASSLV